MKKPTDLIQPVTTRKAGHCAPETFSQGVVAHQQQVQEQLPQLVARSQLHLWKPGDPIVSQPSRILLGVAPWCRYDLELLDALDTAAAKGQTGSDRLDVFLFSMQIPGWSQQRLDQFIPGMALHAVLGPPLLGIWEQGIIQGTAWGPLARDLLRSRYCLPT